MRALAARAAAGVSIRVVSDPEQAFNKGAAVFDLAEFAYTVVDEPRVHDPETGRQVL